MATIGDVLRTLDEVGQNLSRYLSRPDFLIECEKRVNAIVEGLSADLGLEVSNLHKLPDEVLVDTLLTTNAQMRYDDLLDWLQES